MINICLHNKKYKTKPSSSDAGFISSEIAKKEVSITFEDFVLALNKGQTWAPGVFDGKLRKASKWERQQVFVADIDNQNLSLEEIQKKSANFDIPLSIAHESFSSTPEHRKWRLIFISSTVVEDPVVALAILRKISMYYDSDTCTVDLARLLYSSNKGVRFSEENYFDADSINIENYLKKSTPISNKEVEKLPDKSKTSQKSRILWNKATRKIIYNKTDPRYMIIWHTSRELAQSGMFSKADIVSCIESGIQQSDGHYGDYDKNIEEIVINAINWGKRHQWD